MSPRRDDGGRCAVDRRTVASWAPVYLDGGMGKTSFWPKAITVLLSDSGSARTACGSAGGAGWSQR